MSQQVEKKNGSSQESSLPRHEGLIQKSEDILAHLSVLESASSAQLRTIKSQVAEAFSDMHQRLRNKEAEIMASLDE